MSFFNSLLAVVYYKLALLRNGNKFLSFLIVIFSYYFFVLFFSADRLKFSFLFLGLALLYKNKIRNLYFYIALLSHIQTLIIFTSINIKKFKSIFKISYIFYFFTFSLIILYLFEHILNKLPAYLFKNYDIFGILKIIFFYILAKRFSKEKNIFIYFLPILFFSLFFGGDRIVIYSYFLFMYFSLNYKNGLNFGVILVNLYFFFESINFIYKILNRR